MKNVIVITVKESIYAIEGKCVKLTPVQYVSMSEDKAIKFINDGHGLLAQTADGWAIESACSSADKAPVWLPEGVTVQDPFLAPNQTIPKKPSMTIGEPESTEVPKAKKTRKVASKTK
jgi:hypothetical protein